MARYRIQLAVCIAMLVLPGCIFVAFNRKEVTYDYKIDILNHGEQPYTVQVPIPLYTSALGTTRPSTIVSKIAGNGDVTFQVTDTIHGAALHIEGTRNASLQAEGNNLYTLDTLYRGATLSLFDSADVEQRHYWVHYKSPSPDEISIRVTYHYRDDQIGSLIEWDYDIAGDLVQGWNSIPAQLSSRVTDKSVSSSLIVGGFLFVVITSIAFACLLLIMHKHKKEEEKMKRDFSEPVP